MTLLRGAAIGALAGAVGTAAMDLTLYGRYRRGGGKERLARWEFAGDVMGWDDASAPGQLGRKVLTRLGRQEPPEQWARPVTNIVHWATGIGWGVLYGLSTATAQRSPWIRALALGPTVWLSGYVILPLAKVYEPIWKYDSRTLAEDLAAHLVYGAATASTLASVATTAMS